MTGTLQICHGAGEPLREGYRARSRTEEAGRGPFIHGAVRGRRTVKQEPFPGMLRTSMEP